MFEQTFKNIDDILHKDAGCGSELYYVEQTSHRTQWEVPVYQTLPPTAPGPPLAQSATQSDCLAGTNSYSASSVGQGQQPYASPSPFCSQTQKASEQPSKSKGKHGMILAAAGGLAAGAVGGALIQGAEQKAEDGHEDEYED